MRSALIAISGSSPNLVAPPGAASSARRGRSVAFLQSVQILHDRPTAGDESGGHVLFCLALCPIDRREGARSANRLRFDVSSRKQRAVTGPKAGRRPTSHHLGVSVERAFQAGCDGDRDHAGQSLLAAVSRRGSHLAERLRPVMNRRNRGGHGVANTGATP